MEEKKLPEELHGAERRRETSRRYYAEHKEKFREYKDRYAAKHAEQLKHKYRERYLTNQDARIQQARDKRAAENPYILEIREKREFFRDNGWARVAYHKYKPIVPWPEFKEACKRLKNGPCDICGKVGERMTLDHCHARMTFRGVLCRKCNAGLGLLKDDLTLLQKALEYLRKPIEGQGTER